MGRGGKIAALALAVSVGAPSAFAAPGDTELASVNGKGKPLDKRSGLTSISGSGRYTTFTIDLGLQPRDILPEADVWMYDARRDRGKRISGGPRNFDQNFDAEVSGDARYTAFVSDSRELVKQDTDSGPVQNSLDIFVYDRKRKRNTWVSRDGGKGGRQSFSPTISANGRHVAFVSNSNNLPVPEDLTGERKDYQVFVYDRKRKKTRLVSRTDEGGVPDQSAFEPSISGDGRYVTYYSRARDLAGGDDGPSYDVFRFDTRTKETVLVSVADSGADGGHGDSREPDISDDGNLIAFSSGADDLVPDDGNGDVGDVFVRDLDAGTTTIVSDPVPDVPGGADGAADAASISADGRYVAFASDASNLGPGDTNGVDDVYRYDLLDGSLELVSSAAGGAAGNDASRDPALSADGGVIAFVSEATDLADRDGEKDSVFVRELAP